MRPRLGRLVAAGGYNPIPFQFTTLVPADRRLEPGREEREVSLTCYNADTLTTSPTHRGDIQRQRRKKRPKTILSLPAPETLPTPTSDSSMSSSKKVQVRCFQRYTYVYSKSISVIIYYEK